MKEGSFKSKTANNRIAKTTVRLPMGKMVAVKQTILCTQEDLDNDWFNNFTIIKSYKGYRLVEKEMVFWLTSFLDIVKTTQMLESEF